MIFMAQTLATLKLDPGHLLACQKGNKNGRKYASLADTWIYCIQKYEKFQ